MWMLIVALFVLVLILLGKGASTSSKAGNVIESKVLPPADVATIQALANALGKSIGLRGFANFREAQIGVLSVALGVLHKNEPIMIGTIVASSEPDGRYSCSIRGPRGLVVPGPEYYSDLKDALLAAEPFFLSTVQAVKEHIAAKK